MSQGTDTDPLSILPGYLLRRAANAMMTDLSARLSTLDLRISDASVLILAGSRIGITSSELGRELDIQRANMVPLLNRLEDAQLVAREPIDRKSQAIVLTDVGRDMLAKVQKLIRAFEADLMDRIPLEHRDHFVPTLRSLIA